MKFLILWCKKHICGISPSFPSKHIILSLKQTFCHVALFVACVWLNILTGTVIVFCFFFNWSCVLVKFWCHSLHHYTYCKKKWQRPFVVWISFVLLLLQLQKLANYEGSTIQCFQVPLWNPLNVHFSCVMVSVCVCVSTKHFIK